MKHPKLILGGIHTDHRGKLSFNNDFNMSTIKRIYSIENSSINIIRAWQGHKIERRWFSTIQGEFEVKLIKIDCWDSPSKNLNKEIFKLDDQRMDILAVPSGYISSIQAKKPHSKLLVMSDFNLGEIEDEFRFEYGYFNTDAE